MSYKTKSGRSIYYYGDTLGKEIKAKNESYNGINNLDDLFLNLLNCWCKETAYPSCQSEYDQINDPTYGQCAITATIVYDLFGGTIRRIRVNGGGTHYFNEIDNNYIDLTSDQFTLYNIPVDYTKGQIIDRKYCGTNKDTLKRYNLLMGKLENELKNT